jgi:hypothetical protein
MNHFFIFANERWEISKAEQPALLPTTSLISPRKARRNALTQSPQLFKPKTINGLLKHDYLVILSQVWASS